MSDLCLEKKSVFMFVFILKNILGHFLHIKKLQYRSIQKICKLFKTAEES